MAKKLSYNEICGRLQEKIECEKIYKATERKLKKENKQLLGDLAFAYRTYRLCGLDLSAKEVKRFEKMKTDYNFA